MRIKNIIITVIMLGIAGYGGLKLYMWNKARHNVDLVFNGISSGLTSTSGLKVVADYKSISTSLFGPIGIKGISIKIPELGEEVSIAEIKLLERVLDFDVKKGRLPLKMHVVVNGFHMNVSLYEKIFKNIEKTQGKHKIKKDPSALVNRLGYNEIVRRSNNLRRLGYRKIDMDLEFNINIDAKSQEAVIYFRQNMKNYGDFQMTLNVVGMSGKLDNVALGLQIKEARLEFADKSFTNRLIKIYADEKRMALPVYRKKLIGVIKKDFTDMKLKLSDNSVSNILAFVNKPEKIIFTIYPFRPVAVESIKHYKVGDIPALLNIQAYLK